MDYVDALDTIETATSPPCAEALATFEEFLRHVRIGVLPIGDMHMTRPIGDVFLLYLEVVDPDRFLLSFTPEKVIVSLVFGDTSWYRNCPVDTFPYAELDVLLWTARSAWHWSLS